jgi:hypothetical protein
LPIGNRTGLPPTKCPAYPGRVTRQPREVTYERILREIRKTCTSIDAIFCSCCSPTSSQRTCRSPGLGFNFDAEGVPKLNSNCRWEEQEGAVNVGELEFCHHSHGQGRGFADRLILAFLHLDRLAEPIRDALEAAQTILAQPCIAYWCPSPIGRSR